MGIERNVYIVPPWNVRLKEEGSVLLFKLELPGQASIGLKFCNLCRAGLKFPLWWQSSYQTTQLITI